MRNIVICASGSSNWIGGIYYARNIAFQLAVNEKISSACRIYLYVAREYAGEFDDLPPSVKVVPVKQLPGKLGSLQKLLFCVVHRAKYVLYRGSKFLRLFGSKRVNWIPDFQEKYLPEYFSAQEVQARDKSHKSDAVSSEPLVLSSVTALKDFQKFYGQEKKNVIVMPFVSYIEPIIRNSTPADDSRIIQKHGLEGLRYACVMNQFWQHKNHTVVIEALRLYYHAHQDSKLVVVFTGKLSDYRNSDYISSIEAALKAEPLSDHINLLGFISREEQIIIMKHSEFVIQPSLFEGWGTVVEDAKVLDKTILLSDIPVHREQKNSKCIMFNPHDPQELADLIASETLTAHNDDPEKGIADMYTRAKEYTGSFADFLLEGKM